MSVDRSDALPQDEDSPFAENVPVPVPSSGGSSLPPAPPPSVICWRCSKEIPATGLRCPFCEAEIPDYLMRFATTAQQSLAFGTEQPWMAHDPPEGRGVGSPGNSVLIKYRSENDASKPIIRLLILFGVLQLTTIVFHLIAHGILEQKRTERDIEQTLLTFTAIVEAVDAVVVVFSLALLPRVSKFSVSPSQRTWGWLGAFPLLVLALGLNLSYGWALRHIVNFPEWFKPETIKDNYLVWSILMICVQPAIIEELFFRYLALGTLREFVGTHGAVWISSVMFGMAHIGNPTAIPILMVIGALFGYARVASNSMIPPMLMHFFHNGAIVYMEQGSW